MAPLYVLWDGDEVDIEAIPEPEDPPRRRPRRSEFDGTKPWRIKPKHFRRSSNHSPEKSFEGRGPREQSNGGSQ